MMNDVLRVRGSVASFECKVHQWVVEQESGYVSSASDSHSERRTKTKRREVLKLGYRGNKRVPQPADQSNCDPSLLRGEIDFELSPRLDETTAHTDYKKHNILEVAYKQ